jgi:glutamine amidotransferase
MCRFAAYLGPEVPLERLLLQPDHSLVKQSYQPREMATALLNADGFGVGWFNEDERPAAYRNTLPIWADPNIADLARSFQRPLWLAYVRSATDGFSTGLSNTQPFTDTELVFFHNGFVDGFAAGARPRLRQWLRPEIEAGIHGNTDSEYLFAVLRQLLWEDEEASVEDALRSMCELVADWAGRQRALLNLAVSDGRRVYSLRHALHFDCPSLYYTTDDELFPAAQVLASEPLTEAGFWQPVPPHHLLILDPDEPPALAAL